MITLRAAPCAGGVGGAPTSVVIVVQSRWVLAEVTLDLGQPWAEDNAEGVLAAQARRSELHAA